MTEPSEPCPPCLSVEEATARSDWDSILLWNGPSGHWASRLNWTNWTDRDIPRQAMYEPPPPADRVDPSVPANLYGRILVGRTEPITGVQYVENRAIQWTETPPRSAQGTPHRLTSWYLPLPIEADGLVAVKPL